MSKSFSLRARMQSFRHALAGLPILLREQHNTRIHLLASALVSGLALWLGVSSVEWVLLLLSIALVWLAEALNSALEYLADAAIPEQHELVRKAKDVAASGVLICAAIAVLAGALVFAPYLF